MNPYLFALLAFALVSSKPITSLGATELTIGRSTINPRTATPDGSGQTGEHHLCWRLAEGDSP
jgi:hypothetical protein